MAIGDGAAAIVPGDGEPFVPEVTHERDDVPGHGTFRVRGVTSLVSGFEDWP
ncbi:hypothetical protein [Amycolatopsis sp. WAC 01416]|uniref:hypothetical protein n=1 Tax=Amycolatopsis sp. WAC 01416 TaxID=2203196 RepID=UPI001315A971